MVWNDIPFNPPARTLRQFAGLALVFLDGIGAWQALVRSHTTLGTVLVALGVAIGLAGLLRPALVRPVFVGSMLLTFPIGWVVSRVILALMFFGMFTPLALLFRLTGRDALRLRRNPGASTYWSNKPSAPDMRSYFRQS